MSPVSPAKVSAVPMTASAARVDRNIVLGMVVQNQRRSRADTMENNAKYRSIKKLKVSRASGWAARPKDDQPIHKSKSVSATIATPSAADTATKPPMFQVSGFCDGRVWSVARVITAKSVTKTKSSITKAEMTNCPVDTKAMATKAALRIVRLILLITHVRMRW